MYLFLACHSILYPPDNQTGSFPSTLLHFLAFASLTCSYDGLSCACGWLSLSVAFLNFLYASHFSWIPFTQLLFYRACPLSFPLLPVCSLVSCRLQQTPAHFQLCVQNDNKLRQPPACLSFLSKTFQPPNLQTHAVDSINTLLQHS